MGERVMHFFLVGAGTGYLLAGLKRYIYRGNLFNLCCFVLLFAWYIINCLIICTVLLSLVLQVKFYSCFFIQFLFDSDTVHIKVTVIGDVILYSLVNMFVCFGGNYFLYLHVSSQMLLPMFICLTSWL
jgi:hypothetical protein